MQHREFTVDFFKVVDAGKTVRPLETVLAEIDALPKKSRVKDLEGGLFSLYHASKRSEEFIFGEIGRMTMDLIDPKGNLEGDLAPMPVEDNEGQVRPNFFVYHLKTRCLALPFQQSGVRSSKLTQYVNSISGPDTLFSLEPIWQKAKIRELLARMNHTRKAQLKIHIHGNKEVFREAGLGDDEVIVLADKYHAADITLELSIGKQQNTLAGVKQLLGKYGTVKEAVRVARILGTDDAGEKMLIDLLGMTVRDKKRIEIANRSLSPTSAYSALAQAIVANMRDIEAN